MRILPLRQLGQGVSPGHPYRDGADPGDNAWRGKNTFGTLEGRTPAGPVTFGLISTDDLAGRIVA